MNADVATLTPERAASLSRALLANVERVLRGKRSVAELAAIGIVAQGHLLLEDVPGVGKTTLARALAWVRLRWGSRWHCFVGAEHPASAHSMQTMQPHYSC